MKKPIIGVAPIWDADKDSIWMLPEYMEGVIEAGGIPLILPLSDDAEILESTLQLIDGILLTGGPDISPSMYGDARIELTDKPFALRDDMEKALFLRALQLDIPVFGICRGL
jgi:putative glutamine amidotransferase